MAELTRMRIEAHGATTNDVGDLLQNTANAIRGEGEWEEEDRLVTPTKNGFWGRLTWRRKGSDNATSA